MSLYASTGFSRLACRSSLMLFKYFSEEFGDQPDSLIMKAFADIKAVWNGKEV